MARCKIQGGEGALLTREVTRTLGLESKAQQGLTWGPLDSAP
jgi:hypothetical protein